jgi:hypothetical protein
MKEIYYLIEEQQDNFYLYVQSTKKIRVFSGINNEWDKCENLPKNYVSKCTFMTSASLIRHLNQIKDNYHINLIKEKLGWYFSEKLIKEFDEYIDYYLD